MKDRINILLITVAVSLASACNDDLNLNVPDIDDKIVIDGWIENGQFAKVLLTRNSAYFSSIDSASIRSLVLTGAKVTLSDGDRNEVLILRRNEDYFPPFIFEGNEIIGDTGKIYTITAEYGGKKAWAITSIPPAVGIDSVFFIKELNSDSLGTIHVEFTDPPSIKNYYRILTKRIGKDRRYYSTLVMAIDDNFFNGRKFGFTLNRGPESFNSSGANEYFKSGDTVSIKFCTIDKPHFDFWQSFQDEMMNAGNPFASSLSVIKSNIQETGLGIWGGYGVSYHTLIIE